MKNTGFLALTLILTTSQVQANSAKVLIYKGDGSCVEDCSETFTNVARIAKTSSSYVTPKELNEEVLQNAKVWIQPGGQSMTLARVITEKQKGKLRQFIWNGGTYLGFCAGAYFANKYVHDDPGARGLGIFPGQTYDYGNIIGPQVLPIVWSGINRVMYFEDGPGFKLPEDHKNIAIIARYSDQTPASLTYKFGRGWVVLTGPHPEAPNDWFDSSLPDPDGNDNALVADLLKQTM